MSVQELGAIHARYVELSGRFKAAWTFHQFLQGLQNLSVEPELSKYRADFQVAYGALKDLAGNLTSGAVDKLTLQTEFCARQLAQQVEALLAADQRVSPSLLRQFFDRVRNSDEKILAQMVRFYLYAARDSRWTGDRIDKVDFLVTKLSEQPMAATQQLVLRDREGLREQFQGFWALANAGAVSGVEVERRRREMEAIRSEVIEVGNLEDLNQRGVVARYRELKHVLGALFFEPELLLTIAEINLALKNAVRRFYRLEEQRIVTEYHQVFELEGRVRTDETLDQEISQLREAVDQFERKQRRDDVKLQELVEMKRQVGNLLPRLTGERPAEAATSAEPERGGSPDDTQASRPRSAPAGSRLTSDDELLGETFRQLVEVLEGTDRAAKPKEVTLLREVFTFRLEPREVVAYRRLFGTETCDREMEQFLLEAAALRVRVNREAEEITGLLDETAVTREAPVFSRARLTTRLADAFVQHFQHLIEQSVQSGNFVEAQAMQLLRMRLIRDYSGLWLLLNRPTSSE